MADDPKKNNPPDIADGSMAYMPKPVSDSSEKEDEIQLHNKAEEHKSMADLAEELGKEKITASSSGKPVSVAINGKPREVKKAPAVAPVVKTAAKPAPKPNELPADKPHVPELVDTDMLGGNDDLPPVRMKAREAGGSGKKGIVTVLLAIALIAAGIFGYLWYQASTTVASLESDLAKAKSTTASSSASPSPTPSASTNVRSIPELGLAYSFSTDTGSITYRYRELIDAEKAVHKVITLSSTKIVEAERKVSNATPKCTAEFGPLGTITSYATGEIYKGKAIESQAEGNASITKVGTTYYVFEASQAACSTNKAVQDAVTSEKTNVTAFFKSLKVQE